MNRNFLKEAIADAKAVKESAIANAKVALEEAFSPQVQAMFASKLEEMEKEDVDEGYDEIDEAKDDADISAGLPLLFSQLEEAWITVANIEQEGALGSTNLYLKSAPCGTTAAFCLGADGQDLSGIAYTVGSDHFYQLEYSGSSFAAPQVSAAIAILAQAFPNQTPEQWADRLLASANNNTSLIGAHTGAVTFGNGVQHGYNASAGHGMLDVYAALQPIENDSYTRTSYLLDNSGQAIALSADASILRSSSSFGNGLQLGLSDVENYFYDALGGGFKYNLSGHVLNEDNEKIKIDVNFGLLDSNKIQKYNEKLKFASKVRNLVLDDLSTENTGFTVGLFEPSTPIHNFITDENDNFLGFNNVDAPYLDVIENGYTIGYSEYLNKNLKYSIGFEKPMQTSDNNYEGTNTSVSYSLEHQMYDDKIKNNYLIGRISENEKFLGSDATGMFYMENLKTDTDFLGFKTENIFGESLFVKSSYTVGRSTLNYTFSPLVKKSSDIISDSFELAISKTFIEHGLKTVLSINQPNRVLSGNMTINQPGLISRTGELAYTSKEISLAPNGRQLNIGLGLQKDFTDDVKFISKVTLIDEYNHNKNSRTEYGLSFVSQYKNFKLGYGYESFGDNSEIKLNYETKF